MNIASMLCRLYGRMKKIKGRKVSLIFESWQWYYPEGFPGGTGGKEPACQCRKLKRHGFIPGWGRSPGEEHGNPFQYPCLENTMDREEWRATVHGAAKSRTWLSDLARTRVMILQQPDLVIRPCWAQVNHRKVVITILTFITYSIPRF